MNNELISILKGKHLKVTPQRIAVLKALKGFSGSHPSVEEITEFVRRQTPHIAKGTIYKVLEVFVNKAIIRKVHTDRDVLRYDIITTQHHHLYSDRSARIVDYHDENLNRVLYEYFRDHAIPGFKIDDIQLNIKGDFTDNK